MNTRAAHVMRTSAVAACSLSPKVFEPRWGQLSVPHCVLNVLVPEVCLQGAGVVSAIREGINYFLGGAQNPFPFSPALTSSSKPIRTTEIFSSKDFQYSHFLSVGRFAPDLSYVTAVTFF